MTFRLWRCFSTQVADFVIPVFTVLEYLFYMGWLKVFTNLKVIKDKFSKMVKTRLQKRCSIPLAKMTTTLTLTTSLTETFRFPR